MGKNIFRKRYDVVISVAPPFHLGLLPLIYTKLRLTKMVTHIQDLQVDVAKQLGMIKNSRFLNVMLAFATVLKKPIQVNAIILPFVLKYIMPVIARLNDNIHDMYEMIKWIDTGVYISKNPQRQKELFGELPTVEESVGQYCRDRRLI